MVSLGPASDPFAGPIFCATARILQRIRASSRWHLSRATGLARPPRARPLPYRPAKTEAPRTIACEPAHICRKPTLLASWQCSKSRAASRRP